MKFDINLMGIQLRNPLIVASSSLTNSVKNVLNCEKHGAAAVVLKSLYEEQILADSDKLVEQDEMYQWYPQAMDFVQNISKEEGLEAYLNLIRSCKKNVGIPVFASINCYSAMEWPKFANEIENAGADAIELNITIFPSDPMISPLDIESRYMEIINTVRKIVKVPVTVKLSSYFMNIQRIVMKMCEAGASGMVLFNRLYRPDIDIDSMKMITRDTLSSPEELTHSLRWIGLLSAKVRCDLIAGTGIHDAAGVIKQLLAGAKAVEICSVLYENGIGYIRDILNDMEAWMKRKGYDSIDDFRGLINLDPHNSAAWERIHFMKKTSGNIIKPIKLD